MHVCLVKSHLIDGKRVFLGVVDIEVSLVKTMLLFAIKRRY